MSEERLTIQQESAAQLLASGGIEKQDIADKVGVSRTTLWKWENKDLFRARVDELQREFESFGVSLISSKFVEAVNDYWDLIKNTENSRVKAEGLRYFIDRKIGKPTNKVDVGVNSNLNDGVNEDIIDAEFDQLIEEYANED
ncbi:phBC6A51 family helix-turn-helix protein [Metabacillus fastidiosus]|uniref:phBC6A51 family helix-turn-helix protein n=1 Tax=Metabacillus fastidiosus TaxID=1458 RepID=UPI003D2662E7